MLKDNFNCNKRTYSTSCTVHLSQQLNSQLWTSNIVFALAQKASHVKRLSQYYAVALYIIYTVSLKNKLISYILFRLRMLQEAHLNVGLECTIINFVWLVSYPGNCANSTMYMYMYN